MGEELTTINLKSSSAYLLSYSEYYECFDHLQPVDPISLYFDLIDDGLDHMFFTGKIILAQPL